MTGDMTRAPGTASTYRAILTPKEDVESSSWNVSLDHLEMTFTLGDKVKLTGEEHLVSVLKSWHLFHLMDFTVEEIKPSIDVVPVNTKVDPRTCPIPGMYRIRYIKPGGRIELESCMRLTSRRVEPFEGPTLQFSARPRLGTQQFRSGQILSMFRVPDDADIYVNHDPRKGNPKGWRYER